MGSLLLTYESDIEIIDEYVANGNHKAANAFIRKYQKFVFSVALRYLKNEVDADDASQEVFIKALRNLKSFRKESSVNTWLYKITSNVCKNVLRKRKVMSIFSYGEQTEDFFDIPSEIIAPDKQIENKELEAEFISALNSLPAKQRETFALRYFEELPYEEISQMLGTSVGGLKANYFQATKKLAKLLADKK